jgi:hypothetical protein
MRLFRRYRIRPVVPGLLILTGACYSVQPLRDVAPAEFVERSRPLRVVVVTTRGETIVLALPVVARDSLVATGPLAALEEITIARPPDSAVTPLPPDARGYRRIRVTTSTGESLEVSRPRVTADSLSGYALVTRGPGRAVALADIREIRVRRPDGAATFLAVAAGLSVVGIAIFVLTFSAYSGS